MNTQTQTTDAEILDVADDFRSQYKHGGTTFDEFNALGFARAVLVKWGTPAGAGRLEVTQADSVLEDAADPLQGAANWLAEAHGQFSPVVLSGCLMIGYNRAKRLHDAALAARKQGGNNAK